MAFFLYIILAIGFVVSLFVLLSVMTGIRENNKDETAQRDTPQEEQQHDVPGHAGEKKVRRA